MSYKNKPIIVQAIQISTPDTINRFIIENKISQNKVQFKELGVVFMCFDHDGNYEYWAVSSYNVSDWVVYTPNGYFEIMSNERFNITFEQV